MKKFYYYILTILILLSVKNFAQGYTMSIVNGKQIDGTHFRFDVYIQASSTSFNMGSYQGALTFNSGIINSGILSFNYIATTSELSNYPSTGIGVSDDGGHKELTFGSSVGNDLITTTSQLVGTFEIVNTNTFGIVTPDIAWDFAGSLITKVFNSSFVDITSSGTFSDLIYTGTLPVELSTFSASVKQNIVNLKWQTKTEVNNYGFEIERKADDESATWEKVGFIKGSGNSNSPKNYSFADKNITGGSKFSYRLKQIDNDGTFTYSSNVDVEVVPNKFELFQNYPNPFNPATTIEFSLAEDSRIAINIYDILGKKVAQLLNADYKAGYYKVQLNSTDFNLASGVYFYTIESKNFKAVKKMVLMK